MQVPPGALPDSFAIRFIYEKGGKEFEFAPSELPADLNTYNFLYLFNGICSIVWQNSHLWLLWGLYSDYAAHIIPERPGVNRADPFSFWQSKQNSAAVFERRQFYPHLISNGIQFWIAMVCAQLPTTGRLFALQKRE